MTKKLLSGLLGMVLWAAPAWAQLGTVPHSFSPNTPIISADVNENFSTAYANACNRTGCIMTGSLTTLGIVPTSDDASDLGSLSRRYQDAFFSGQVLAATLKLIGSGGAGKILQQTSADGVVTVATFASTSLSDTSNLARLNTTNSFVTAVAGPSITLNNGTLPVFIEFNRTGYAALGNVGLLGGPEMNLSFNMDYSDNSHQFYDNTKNAFWIALGDLGMTLQYAPAGASGPDIWATSGNSFLNVSNTGTLSVAENVGVLEGRRFILDGTRSQPQDAPGFSGSDTYILSPSANVASIFSGGVEAKFASGVFNTAGFGTHRFSAAGTGGNIVAIRNSTAGTGNYSQLWLGTDEAEFVGVFSAYSSTWTTSGAAVASGVQIAGAYAGGLSLSASHASGAIRFYANGSTLRGSVNTGWQFGAPTGGDQGAGTLNVSGGLYLNGVAYANPSEFAALQERVMELEARLAVLEGRR